MRDREERSERGQEGETSMRRWKKGERNSKIEGRKGKHKNRIKEGRKEGMLLIPNLNIYIHREYMNAKITKSYLVNKNGNH